jgi:hypothetical protein
MPWYRERRRHRRIVYGYYTHTDAERQELHEKVSSGLGIGVELIKSTVASSSGRQGSSEQGKHC